MFQRLLGRHPPRRIELKAPLQELDSQRFVWRQLLIVFRVFAGARSGAASRPEDDLFEREAALADGCYGCFKDAACAGG